MINILYILLYREFDHQRLNVEPIVMPVQYRRAARNSLCTGTIMVLKLVLRWLVEQRTFK